LIYLLVVNKFLLSAKYFLNFIFNIVYWKYFYIFEIYFYNLTSFYAKSNFFKIFKKKILHYVDFKISIKMSNFLGLGQYIEYYRLFKYFEYIKRFPVSIISYKLKNCFRKLTKYNWPLWQLYRANVYPDDEDDEVCRIYECNFAQNIISPFKFKNIFLNLKQFFIKWPFLLSGYLQRLSLHSHYHFFSTSFIFFIYKCLYIFKHFLALFLKFKNTSPRDMFKFFKRARFNFTKWILLYYFRLLWKHQQYLKINYFFLVEFFQYNSLILLIWC
jgi:hypothetical protein